MKVSINLTVDIDPEVWDLNYGTGTSAVAVREDVKRYCESTIIEQLVSVGVWKEA